MAAVTNNALSRSIGGLEARMQTTEERLARMEEKLDKVVDAVAMSRGSLKTLMVVGSVISAITAAIASVLTWMFGHK